MKNKLKPVLILTGLVSISIIIFSGMSTDKNTAPNPVNESSPYILSEKSDLPYELSGRSDTSAVIIEKDNNKYSVSLSVGQALKESDPVIAYSVNRGGTNSRSSHFIPPASALDQKLTGSNIQKLQITELPVTEPSTNTETYAPAETTAVAAQADSASQPETGETDDIKTTNVSNSVNTKTAVANVKPKTTESAAKKSDTDTSVNSGNELDLLARLITAEAQGEPYEAKVAVGAVVMNRVKSDLFPGSIRDVIYQNIEGYYQFTPVVNGWIDKPAQADCIKAAKEAINGRDPTNGALFYYDNKTTNTWILSKPVSITIGNMIYAY